MDFKVEIDSIESAVESAVSKLESREVSDVVRTAVGLIDRLTALRTAIDEELESKTIELVEETRALAGSRRVDVYERIASLAEAAKEIATLAAKASSLLSTAQRVASLREVARTGDVYVE